LHPLQQFTRDAIGMIGLTALRAAILGADRAWIFLHLDSARLEIPQHALATIGPVLEHLLIGGTAVRAAEPTAAMPTSRD
jgi:hypothetical protein